MWPVTVTVVPFCTASLAYTSWTSVASSTAGASRCRDLHRHDVARLDVGRDSRTRSVTPADPAWVVHLEGDIVAGDGADGRADDTDARACDFDLCRLTDVLCVSLDVDEVPVGEHVDVVGEHRHWFDGNAAWPVMLRRRVPPASR